MDISLAVANVNYLAVVVAAFAAMFIGYLWYGPVFGKPWMKAMGYTKKDVEGSGWMPMFWTLILTLVLSWFLSLFLYGVEGITDGLLIGLLLSLGFTAVPTGINFLFDQGRGWKLFLISAGHFVADILVMSAIIVAM